MPTPATLIHNHHAGPTRRIDVDTPQNQLRTAGPTPTYHPTNIAKELDAIPAKAEGPVVTAVADGTVRAVAIRLVDKGVPLAIVPLGTTNNGARPPGVQGASGSVPDEGHSSGKRSE